MGVIKKIRQKIYNGKDWDTLYPETSAIQVLTEDGGNLENKVGRCGKKIVCANGYDKAYNICADLWVGFGNIATSASNSSGGVGWTWNIPKEFKCIEVLGKYAPISSNDGLGASALTTGYVVDSTPAGDNTKFVGGCYDMAENKATRIKIIFFFRSSL